MSNTVLRVDSSPRGEDSLSRQLTAYIAEQLNQQQPVDIVHRDLSKTELPLVTYGHIGAYFTAPDQRSDEQKTLLGASDKLVQELKSAQQLIIGAPMYNFSVTASLKAWIDLICRVGETFKYGENGPQGLLKIERAFIVVAAGGTPIGSEIDFSSAYLKQVCRFIGIEEVHIINASASKRDPDTLIQQAKQQIDEIVFQTAEAVAV